MYEQALCIYKKFNNSVEAIKVMLYKLNNFEGDLRLAQEYSEKINTPEVWTELGKAQLDKNLVKDSINSFIKAKNPSMYMMIINISQ